MFDVFLRLKVVFVLFGSHLCQDYSSDFALSITYLGLNSEIAEKTHLTIRH